MGGPMRKQVPNNHVNVPYQEILRSIVDILKSQMSENIQSIFITGSYARGDAKEGSDIDLWLVMTDTNFDNLNQVGTLLKPLMDTHKVVINPQCLDIKELENPNFDIWVEKPVKILDGVLLDGHDFFDGPVNLDHLARIYKRYLTDIIMGIRHYVTVNKDKEKLTYKRLETYLLKPLLFPLRMERYHKTGTYPIAKEDLLEAYEGEIKRIIMYSMKPNILEEHIEKDHKTFFKKMYRALYPLLEGASDELRQ